MAAQQRVDKLLSSLFHRSDGNDADIGTPSTRRDIVADIRELSANPPTNHASPEAANQIEYLKDLVLRLNHELERYQQKYPPLEKLKPNLSLAHEVFPNWLTHFRLFSPLLKAYDEKIAKLEKDLVAQKRLGSNGPQSAGEINEESESRIRILQEENDLLMEQQQKMNSELERLRNELAIKMNQNITLNQDLDQLAHTDHETKETLAALNQANLMAEKELNVCKKNMKVLADQNDWMNEELRRLRNENSEIMDKLVEAKNSIHDLTLAYKNGLHDVEESTKKFRQASIELKSVEAQADEYKAVLAETEQSLKIMQNEYEVLLDTQKSLEGRVIELEEQSVLHLQKTSSQMQEIDDIRAERDRFHLREQQLQQELERFKIRLQQAADRQQEKLESETQSLQSQFATEKRKLLQEMSELEISRAELQLQMERAIRDKRSVEMETEKIRKHVPLEIDRLHALLEELQEKQRRLERERDDASFQLERAISVHQRKENDFEKLKHHLAFESELAEKRLKRAESELLQTKNENMTLFKKFSELEHSHKQFMEETEVEKRQLDLDLANTRRLHERELKDLKNQYDQTKEMNSKLSKEMQDLLSEQQVTSLKWREEYKAVSGKYERVICQLKDQIESLQQRLEQVSEDHSHVRVLNEDLSSQLTEEKKIHARLHSLLQQAESRGQQLSRQLHDLIAREKQLMIDKKELQRLNDRLALEKKRWERERSQSILQTRTKWSQSVNGSNLDEDSLSVEDLQLDDSFKRKIVGIKLEAIGSEKENTDAPSVPV